MNSQPNHRTCRIALGALVTLAGIHAHWPVAAADETPAATPTEKVEAYIDTAKPTEDGEIHPRGDEPKPRESWFSPCPPDKEIEKSGDCEPIQGKGSTSKP